MMKNENALNDSFGQAIGIEAILEECTCYEDYESFHKIRDEMNKFLLYLNQCKLSRSIHDQVHNLYVSMIHLDAAENELKSSCLSEEILHQERIFDKFNSLKIMVLCLIKDLSEKSKLL